ncbi:MAG: DUF2142 domain-containing protein [Anaerolineae bacterium]|nr:DUF2142 domain-containing protein [Anaerolineae bacterium]
MFESSQKVFILLISLVIIRGLLYLSIVPPWLAPDEPAHFEAIRLIAQQGLWPTEKVYRETPMHPQMRRSFENFRIWQISRLFSPSAPPGPNAAESPFMYYYAISTGGLIAADGYPLTYHVLLSPISFLSQSLDIVQQLYLLRFVSLFFTTLTFVIGWFFVRTIFPGSLMYAVAIFCFPLFLPMYLHVNTSVNTDVLTTLLSAAFFLFLAKILIEGCTLPRIIGVGAVLITAILVKPTALFLAPTSVAAGLVYLARKFRWKFKVLLILLVVLVGFTFLMAIIFFQVSGGGRTVTLSLSFDLLRDILAKDYFGQKALATYLYTVQWAFVSFWGMFAWNNIPIPGWWAWLLWRICGLIGLGLIIFVARQVLGLGRGERLNPDQRDFLLVLLLSLIFSLIAVFTPIIATQSAMWGPPSRYFFPAILPLALYFFLGFQQLIPARLYKLTLPLWLAGLILFDSLTVTLVLIPSIYG